MPFSPADKADVALKTIHAHTCASEVGLVTDELIALKNKAVKVLDSILDTNTYE